MYDNKNYNFCDSYNLSRLRKLRRLLIIPLSPPDRADVPPDVSHLKLHNNHGPYGLASIGQATDGPTDVFSFSVTYDSFLIVFRTPTYV